MTRETIERRSDRDKLEAILVEVLLDNDHWRVLTELATAAGQGALAGQFAQAFAEERRQLARVRAWTEATTPSGRMRASVAVNG